MNRCPWRGVLAAAVAMGVVGTVGSSSATGSAAARPAAARLVGVSMPSHIAAIAAEQSGTIVEMKVQRGDRIAEGDVLYHLSSRLQQLEVDRLQALFDSELEHEKATASFTHAKKRAERMTQLLSKEISAESAVLEVELESELARLTLNKVDFERAQLQNELQQAKERLEQRTLRSPMDGVVNRYFKQLGETADQLEPVVEVMSLDPLWVQFECPVTQEKMFRRGGTVMVRPVDSEDEPRAATIIFISPQASVAGHTIAVCAALPNEDYSWRSCLKMHVEMVPQPQASPPRGK